MLCTRRLCSGSILGHAGSRFLTISEGLLQSHDLRVGLFLSGKLLFVFRLQLRDRFFRSRGRTRFFIGKLTSLLCGEIGGFLLILEFFALRQNLAGGLFHRTDSFAL